MSTVCYHVASTGCGSHSIEMPSNVVQCQIRLLTDCDGRLTFNVSRLRKLWAFVFGMDVRRLAGRVKFDKCSPPSSDDLETLWVRREEPELRILDCSLQCVHSMSESLRLNDRRVRSSGWSEKNISIRGLKVSPLTTAPLQDPRSRGLNSTYINLWISCNLACVRRSSGKLHGMNPIVGTIPTMNDIYVWGRRLLYRTRREGNACVPDLSNVAPSE